MGEKEKKKKEDLIFCFTKEEGKEVTFAMSI
jgi:hypothetical protein